MSIINCGIEFLCKRMEWFISERMEYDENTVGIYPDPCPFFYRGYGH